MFQMFHQIKLWISFTVNFGLNWGAQLATGSKGTFGEIQMQLVLEILHSDLDFSVYALYIQQFGMMLLVCKHGEWLLFAPTLVRTLTFSSLDLCKQATKQVFDPGFIQFNLSNINVMRNIVKSRKWHLGIRWNSRVEKETQSKIEIR